MSININKIYPTIQLRLSQSLPGYRAQKLMMPEGRISIPDHDSSPVPSAVLIALYEENGIIKFPLIRRPVYNGSHSGQMAFPGGKYEESDGNLENTALRENFEEIGIAPNEIEILGTLSKLYISVTNMQVTPVVGYIKSVPKYKTDPREVDELFTISLADIYKKKYKAKENWNLRGSSVEVPFYLLQNQKVWGATAMILSEFEQATKELITIT